MTVAGASPYDIISCRQVTHSKVHQLYNDPQDEYRNLKQHDCAKNTQVTGFITMCAHIDTTHTHTRVCTHTPTHT